MKALPKSWCGFTIYMVLIINGLVSCKKEAAVEPVVTTPVVRLISPTSSTLLQDSVLVEVEATDDKGIVKVEVYIDNQIPQGGTLAVIPYKYTWDISGLPDSSAHTVFAKAYDADGNVSTTPVLTLVLFKFAPSNLTATAVSDTLVRLTWKDNSRKEDGFEIERKTGTGDFVLVKTVASNITTASIDGAYRTTETTWFRVRAFSPTDKSKYTNQASIVISFVAPSTLALFSVKVNEIVLQWKDNTSFENGFSIERQDGAAPFREIRRVPASSTSAIDTLADTSMAYSYRVRAFTSINTSAYSNTLRIEFTPGAIVALPDLVGHSGVVTSVAFSPDGSLMASASFDAKIKLWKTADGSLLRTLSGYGNDVNSVAFSPDGATLASSGMDGTIRLWHVLDGAPQRTLSLSRYYAHDVAFSPSGAVLATGGFYTVLGGVIIDSNIVFWRTSDGSIVRTMRGDPQEIRSVAFNLDGSLLATGGINDVKLWLVSDGSLLRTLVGHTRWVWSVTFDPSGTIVASASGDSTLRLWRTADGSSVRVLRGFSGGVRSVAFNPSGSTLASACEDKKIKLWRVSDGATLYTFTTTTGFFTSVAFSPDGNMLAAGTNINVIKRWSLKGQWQAVP